MQPRDRVAHLVGIRGVGAGCQVIRRASQALAAACGGRRGLALSVRRARHPSPNWAFDHRLSNPTLGGSGVKLRLLDQPFGNEARVGPVITRALEDPEHREFWFATAWAKRSGLSRLSAPLRGFRSRGGAVYGVVGLDEAGATWEGLELALDLCDQGYVFHDSGPRTFHPKFYVAEGAHRATVVIGSGNATRGGLFTNYEAAVEAVIDKRETEDAAFLGEVRDYWERLVGLRGACVPLDASTIEALRVDPTVMVSREGQGGGGRRGASERAGSTSLFGAPVGGLAGAPPAPVGAKIDEQDNTDDLAPTSGGAGGDRVPDAVPAGVRATDEGVTAFWKTLSRWDVNPGAAPGQIIIPKRFWDFFGQLTLMFDRTEEGGPRQSEAHLTVRFESGDVSKTCDDARVILYEPGQEQARPNAELRFTFRDREVFDQLAEDDVLVFSKELGGIVTVRHQGYGSMGDSRFGVV